MLRWAGLALLLVASAGCVQTVKGRNLPALEEAGKLERVAVAPFRVGRPFSELASPEQARVAAALVSRHFAEGLMRRKVRVVPPGDVERVLGGMLSGEAPVPELARRVAQEFGANALVLGTVSRFVEREGRPAGATRAAWVAFHVTLHAAPGGERLWTASFDEHQKPLGQNVLDASRYPGRGLRWLTAGELARWGAGQVAEAMPLGH